MLVPVDPSGIVFDLFENIHTYLLGLRMKRVPMYFVSPVAEHCLAYANIVSEWLCTSKQEKVYAPEPPFPHEDMVHQEALHHFPDAHALLNSPVYQEPCVVFAGHPSLRFGDVLTFLRIWGQNAKNTLLFLGMCPSLLAS